MVSRKEQVIIGESIQRMMKEAEEEIRSGEVSVLTGSSNFARQIVEPMAPLIIVLSKIALLSKWN